ncbi:hypothetical protein I3843_15G144100 [Carya illinoinensis]|nr:hypothetical protein I3760_15G148900 [Carya illinoinensis]KAG7945287.1 hypothetical protein I3843_15G144100 [Carya illinoinensis]
MAHLDQNLCGRKTKKKERKNRKERKRRWMFSNVLQPNLSHRLSLIKTCCQHYPSATPQKIPIFITVSQKNIIFHRVMWAFLGFLSRSEFHRENRESKNLLTSSPLSLFLICLSFFFLSIPSL